MFYRPDFLYEGIRITRADRGPCIVCGHPTGDCKPEDSPPPIKIFGIGLFKSLDDEQTFLIEEDIYEQRQITAKQSVRVKVYKKGQRISMIEARERGLIESPHSGTGD